MQDEFDVDKEKETIGSFRRDTNQARRYMDFEKSPPALRRFYIGQDFARLMEGAHAQCAVISSYGVGKEYEKAGIEPWFETMRPAIKNICRHADVVCWNIGDLFATGTQFIEPTHNVHIGMFNDNDFRAHMDRIWKKQA